MLPPLSYKTPNTYTCPSVPIFLIAMQQIPASCLLYVLLISLCLQEPTGTQLMFTDCIHYTVVFVLQSNLAGWSALPINEYGLALHLQCELSCSLSLGFFLSFFFLDFFLLAFLISVI